MNQRERATLIDALGTALTHGEESLALVPKMLRRVLEESAWESFTTKLGEQVTHGRFESFVTTPPLAGLGADLALVRRIVAGDPVILDLLDQALQRPPSLHAAVPNINSTERPHGTSSAYALRKLRTARPDLHARVLAGDLSPHAAMLEAGFRHPTITVPIDDVSRLAGTLRRHLDASQLRELAQLL